MNNPVTVEVTRGPLVESYHRGAVAIADTSGKTVLSVGNTAERVFPRSAIKALQALPLVESGAADALDFDEAELALACASHSGEVVHVNSARVMLMKAGLGEDDLECGAHWPRRMEDVAEIIRADETPCQLHNNCSGKHAGFLGLAKVMGVPTRGYIAPDHPVQVEIRTTLEQLTGETLTSGLCGTDGCSIPTYAAPLEGFARAFASFGAGDGLEPGRAEAARRIYDACVNEPFMVAGTGRFCTDVMAALNGRVLVKTGAEGVFCGAVPELGFGIALKCDDGATRAAEVMMGAVLEVLLDLDDEEAKALDTYVNPTVLTRRETPAGEIRPSSDFLAGLKASLA
jgi:L-asparaginase II